MSPMRVKSDTIKIPVSAIGESYPARKGAIEIERKMIIIPDMVRSERILPLIFDIISSLSEYIVSARTVIV